MRLKKHRSQQGSGIVEYILITALTALATVAIFKTFRSDVTVAYQKAGEALVKGVEDGISDGGSGQTTP
jgi:Flp pilus assembly pilin Flp